MKKIYLYLFTVIISVSASTQDTITVMTYNLLNFNNNTQYCTSSNNNVSNKTNYLKTITHYILPDILGVNEVGASNATIQFILDSILNTNGTKPYGRIPFINSSGSNIISTIYYNTNKFVLHSTNFLQTDVRDIIIANLYYRSQELETNHDTVFIRVIQAHLKAGSTSSDQQTRAQQTQIIMNYLNSLGNIKNTILMGDFNVSSSTEQCFQNIINYSNAAVRLYDPVNKLGTWNDNSTFALYHTQSTQLNSNGCTSGGGLDDRFDFIMTSFGILNNLYKINYLTESYKVIGQDGNHFNNAVDNPENYSVPNNVLLALKYMSDHLPVTLKLVIQQTPLIGIENNSLQTNTLLPLSWYNQHLIIQSDLPNEECILTIFDIMGKKLFEQKITLTNNDIPIVTPLFTEGIYFIELKTKNIHRFFKIYHR